jgi:hypothetical protein
MNILTFISIILLCISIVYLIMLIYEYQLISFQKTDKFLNSIFEKNNSIFEKNNLIFEKNSFPVDVVILP